MKRNGAKQICNVRRLARLANQDIRSAYVLRPPAYIAGIRFQRYDLACVPRKINIYAGFREMALKRSTLEGAAERAGMVPVTQ